MSPRTNVAAVAALSVLGVLAARGSSADAKVIAAAPSCTKADAPFRAARVDADAVELCFDGDTPTCWRVDLAARAIQSQNPAALPDPNAPGATGATAPAAPPTAAITVGTHVKVCALDRSDCHEADVPDVATTSADQISANTDRSVIAVPADMLPGPKRVIHLIDTATNHVIATLQPWKTPMGDPSFFHTATFLDDVAFVTISYSPISSAGTLFAARTGKRLADIGGKNGEIDDTNPPLALGGGDWAFGLFAGNDVVVYHLATGKLRKKLAIAGPKARGLPLGNAFALFAKTADDKTIVAVRGDAMTGVTLIDTKTLKATNIGVPTCK